jgi:hypothetical protein
MNYVIIWISDGSFDVASGCMFEVLRCSSLEEAQSFIKNEKGLDKTQLIIVPYYAPEV